MGKLLTIYNKMTRLNSLSEFINFDQIISSTDFFATGSFLYSLKSLENDFLKFSESIERHQLHEMS